LLTPAVAAREADGGQITTVLPQSADLPTESEPQLAVVLVPKSGVPADPTLPADPNATDEPAWVFPFDRPLPPAPGDNRAESFNTTDRSVAYDVAIAMVWVTGENPVLNTNAAYAYASCVDCVTVAVAFQVVVIVGYADVIVPQNLAAAANYECFECITAAIASQLVVTVDSMPGVEDQVALADIWDEVAAFAATIPTLPLAEVLTRLEAYKGEIVAVLEDSPAAPAASPSPLPSSSTAPSPLTSPSSAPPEPSGVAPPPSEPAGGSAAPSASPSNSVAPESASPPPSPSASPEPSQTLTSPSPSF
jgi:putative peptide zinc metalloprotease protein